MLLDQLTKHWALERLSDGRTIDLVGSLRFNLAFNTGMAFSAGSGSGAIIGAVALLIVVVLIVVARRIDSKLQLVLVGIVIGGAIGNVIDRLFRSTLPGMSDGFMSGAVVDFVDLQWWPVFNVADAAIVVGGISLALLSARAPVEEEPTESDEPSEPDRPSEGEAPSDHDEGAPGADHEVESAMESWETARGRDRAR